MIGSTVVIAGIGGAQLRLVDIGHDLETRATGLRRGPQVPDDSHAQQQIARLAHMLRYGVNDLRAFFDGDLRFLSQFK